MIESHRSCLDIAIVSVVGVVEPLLPSRNAVLDVHCGAVELIIGREACRVGSGRRRVCNGGGGKASNDAAIDLTI